MCRLCYRLRLHGWLLALAALPAGGEASVELGAGWPRHEGFLQTPTGGAPGTSSAERPTFAETALRRGAARWLAGAVALQRLRLQVRYDSIGSDGAAQLERALVSQGQAFAAGEHIRSRASFDGLSLALTRRIELPRGWQSELGGEVAWTAFALRIDGERSAVDRSYHVYTIGLLGALHRQLGVRWRIGTVLGMAPGFDGAGSRYRLAPHVELRLGERWALAVGLRWERFRYDDAHKQELPNRLLVQRRVVPALSLRARF